MELVQAQALKKVLHDMHLHMHMHLSIRHLKWYRYLVISLLRYFVISYEQRRSKTTHRKTQRMA
jgi:hypothetical protein